MPTFELPALTGDVLIAAIIIFLLRVVGVTLATVRVLITLRGQKIPAAIMGFFEVLVYVLAIGAVVNNLSNVWNLLGYCLGFAAGTLVGMTIDDYLALGYATVSVISRYKGQNLAEAVREAGYGATVEWGQGRAGTVGVVRITVRRREVSSVVELADQADPDAFVTVEEARSIRRGYLRTARHER
jgi:uncharacterized protein YebE (UPF0316 family)